MTKIILISRLEDGGAWECDTTVLNYSCQKINEDSVFDKIERDCLAFVFLCLTIYCQQ